MQFLNANQVRAIAPSVFATSPAEEAISKDYGFISTADLLGVLEDRGFKVRSVMASGDKEHGFHSLRLQNTESKALAAREMLHKDMLFPEMLLTNSHDGSYAFTLSVALMRLVCTNGLTANAGSFETIRIKHMGFKTLYLNEGIEQVMDQLPKLWSFVELMGSMNLSERQRKSFALAAHSMLGQPELTDPLSLLHARRPQDAGDSLWNIFNRSQENMIRGGLPLRSGQRTRAIRSGVEDLRLNKGVWQIASDFAELVG